LRIAVGHSEDADFRKEGFGGGTGGNNPAAVIASRTRGVASRASSRSSKDFIRFQTSASDLVSCQRLHARQCERHWDLLYAIRPPAAMKSLRAYLVTAHGACLVVAQSRNPSRLSTPALGRKVSVSETLIIEAALRREGRWCVCLHLHSRGSRGRSAARRSPMMSGPNLAPLDEVGVSLPLAKKRFRSVGRQAGTHTRFANLSSDSPNQQYPVRKPSATATATDI
jgi:hypothetical protein